MQPEVLTTSSAALVPPQTKYAADVYSYGRDPKFCQMVDAKPFRSESAAASFIDSLSTDNSAGRRLYWIVTDRNDRAVGTLGFIFPHAPQHKVADLGFGLARAHWGTGLFQEVARRVVDFGFTELELRRIQVVTRSENIAAIKAVTKLGFEKEAVLRSFYQIAGRRIDAVVLSLLRNSR